MKKDQFSDPPTKSIAWKRSIVIFLLVFLIPVGFSFAESPVKPKIKVSSVLYDIPNLENTMGGYVIDFMKVVAEDLNIELDIHLVGWDKVDFLKTANSTLSKSNNPDFLLFGPIPEGITYPFFKAVEKTKVKVFLGNSEIRDTAKILIGTPRGKFKNWIGHMTPDDFQAGYALGKALIEDAEQQFKNKKKISMVALTGDFVSSPAVRRIEGLKKAVAEHPNIVLNQVISAHWSMKQATLKTKMLLDRYPETQIVWTASDQMAYGSLLALNELKKIPGKDVILGGIDWEPEIIKRVESGEISATIGGHLFEGGWILIALYDYYNGIDFKDETLHFKTVMQAIQKKNLNHYKKLLNRENWKQIDFKQFTKTHNPKLKKYDFSIENLINNIE